MKLFSSRKAGVELASPSASSDVRKTAATRGWLPLLGEWFAASAISLTLVLLIQHYGFYLSSVKGASMQPTLQDGQWLFVNKAARFVSHPQRGDVVVIKAPGETNPLHSLLVKRVVAVAGDEVHVRRGKLFVNGQEVKEPYTDTPTAESLSEPYTIASGYVFVMGDNRHRYGSRDSRSFGAVPLSKVEGRADWIVWPLNQWRAL